MLLDAAAADSFLVTEYCQRTCSCFFEMQIAGFPGSGGEGEGIGMREKQAVYYYNFLLFF